MFRTISNLISPQPNARKTPASLEDLRYEGGTGNWRAFQDLGLKMSAIEEAAADWKRQLKGVEFPWLCWNVDPHWSIVQQRLVRQAGWTPLVGFDPRVGPPPLEPGSVLIDFNQHFQFPTMWMHFPLEFVHLFAERMAFWHSDCLIRAEKMDRIARQFSTLADGQTAAVNANEPWSTKLRPKMRRYWELVGCTTAGASADQFRQGCGWWVNFAYHISNSEAEHQRRLKYYWDAGAGIRFWHKRCGGKVLLIPEDYVGEGHFTRINNKNYKQVGPNNFRRDISKELSLNFDLVDACKKLKLENLLE